MPHSFRDRTDFFTEEAATGAGVSSTKDVENVNCQFANKIETGGAHLNSLSVSGDSESVAIASEGSTSIFNLRTGKRIYTFFGQVGKVTSVTIDRDGKTLSSGGFDSKVTSWRLDNKQLLYTCYDRSVLLATGNNCSHLGSVEAIAYSPDGKFLVSGSADKTIKIWHRDTGECKTILRGHSDIVTCLAISPNGKIIASGSVDGTIRLWHLATGALIGIMSKNSLQLGAIAITPDGRILVSAGAKIELWDLQVGTQIATLAEGRSPVRYIAIHPDGKLLASSTLQNRVEIWDLMALALISKLEIGGAIAFTPDGKMLVVGETRGSLNVWRLVYDSDGATGNNFTPPIDRQWRYHQWHEILSVSATADRQEVKRSYIRLAKEYHPDVNPSSEAQLQMQLINRAYAEFCQINCL